MHFIITNNNSAYVQQIDWWAFSVFQKRGVKLVKKDFL